MKLTSAYRNKRAHYSLVYFTQSSRSLSSMFMFAIIEKTLSIKRTNCNWAINCLLYQKAEAGRYATQSVAT